MWLLNTKINKRAGKSIVDTTRVEQISNLIQKFIAGRRMHCFEMYVGLIPLNNGTLRVLSKSAIRIQERFQAKNKK